MEQSAVLLTIIAASLAIVTTKLLGFVLLAGWQPRGYWKECLEFAPGTMITALIVPDLISMGLLGMVSAAVTGVVALLTRSMLATVVTGVLAATAIRAVLG
jgi:uncharacterized membrane protein